MFNCNKNYGSNKKIRLYEEKGEKKTFKPTVSNKDKDQIFFRRNFTKESHVLPTIMFAEVDMLEQEIEKL